MKNKAALALVNRTIETYKEKLFLQGWNISVSPQSKPYEPNPSWLASVVALPEYMSATIELYPRFFQLSKADQIETIVHELSHCHTQAVSNALVRLIDGGALHGYHATELIERLTQTIAIIALSKAS